MKTNKKTIAKYAFNKHVFNTAKEFEQYLQKTGEIPDYVAVAGTLYTMEEYDNEGKEIVYLNKKNMKELSITTSNRYAPSPFKDSGETPLHDAEVLEYPAFCWRNDIVFAE